MTIKEAESIIYNFDDTHASDEELFMFTEAMDFLIKKRKSPRDMMWLGGVYYEKRNFDLALKYYEMAASYDYMPAYSGLGYIWYYGRTGERNYEKAFYNFSKAAELGDIQSAYKVADMYKNGYFVEKDYEKYKETVKELYPKVKNARNLNEPLPEIFTRLAKIYVEENRAEEAVQLYLIAKDFLSQRIKYNAFFGNLNIMKWLIDDLYKLIEFDYIGFDLFDLYHLLKRPVKVQFRYGGKNYIIEAVKDDDECAICFMNKWYKTRDDFFRKAEIDDKPITGIYDRLHMFEVLG